MAGILNGMALHGGVRPYGGTFLVFADYMRPSIRLAALMKLPVIYVFTHDSVAVGEDGPTHQPVEHLAALRCIPGLTVIRPADTAETAEAWRYAVGKAEGPVALLLSRQKLIVISEEMRRADGVENGGYVLSDADGKPEALLLSSGAEVGVTLEAQKLLKEKGVAARVVNMPSWNLFEKTDAAYKEETLPSDVTVRVAVEAGHPMGWERYVGIKGAVIAINGFGASAPGGEVLKRYGFTAENIVEKTLALLGR
jgi:transketolase